MLFISEIFAPLRQFFIRYNIPDHHGWNHAISVMTHALHAVEELVHHLDWQQIDCILLAALLHDVDDRKLFPNSAGNCANARLLMQSIGCPVDMMDLTVEMISLVSTSSNGNTTDQVHDLWKLIPRDCDRLEALGLIGAQRCLQYAKQIHLPIVLPTTPSIVEPSQIESMNLSERFQKYVESKGKSASMIDHYYDKLLSIHHMASQNTVLQTQADYRHRWLLDFLCYVNRQRTINNNNHEAIYNMSQLCPIMTEQEWLSDDWSKLLDNQLLST